MQTQSARTEGLSPVQLFNYPFRIFFLSLGILGVAAIPVWIGALARGWNLPLAMPAIYWHQHEMLFGFLSAAIAGFLLTAVCVWTRTERTHGFRLFALWLVWLSGRLLLASGESLPFALVQSVNLAFLPLVMIDAGWRIWHARQTRQLMILVVLGLLWALQIGFVMTYNPLYVSGGLIMAMALSSIIGGRITPAFSSGWLRQQGKDGSAVTVFPVLDLLTVLSMGLLLAFLLAEIRVGVGLVALLPAGLMLARLIGWKGWLTAREPLLWILHLSLLWIPVSLLLLAGNKVLGWPASAWTHAAGLGVIGSLVLGVIARVSLGHTGRALILPGAMVLAFIAIQAAAVFRVITAIGAVDWSLGVSFSAGLWVVAYALFLICYTGILMKPRADGREG